MIPSKIKLKEFNDCPGREKIEEYLDENNVYPHIEIVDLEERLTSYYTNASDTLVVAIIKGGSETVAALTIGQIATHCHADEFHWKVVEGVYVVRLWWD